MIKQRIHDILAVTRSKGDASWYFDIFLVTLIILNVAAIVIGSVPEVQQGYRKELYAFEVFSVAVFSLEYVLRLWTVVVEKKYSHPIKGRIAYAMTPMALIDLFAVLPFYLPMVGLDLRLLRILRIFRLFRLFKLARYMSAMHMIHNVLRNKREELVISLIFTLFMLLITSTMMYYVENEAQPDKFVSIPQTMWWGIATLTTVGYGDVFPITPIGKLLGGAIALIGVGVFALPAGILASGFGDEIAHRRHRSQPCPQCGHVHDQELHEL